MFHHSLGIQDPCRESSPHSLLASFDCLGQLSQAAFQGCLTLHVDKVTLSGASCGPASYNSYQTRYFSYEQRDGLFTPSRHIPNANKMVTGVSWLRLGYKGAEKVFISRGAMGKYHMKCFKSLPPQREHGRIKEP